MAEQPARGKERRRSVTMKEGALEERRATSSEEEARDSSFAQKRKKRINMLNDSTRMGLMEDVGQSSRREDGSKRIKE